MQVETFLYQSGDGWSVDAFPQLDSPRTLVLAFGAPSFRDDDGALRELKAAYPSSLIAGCSTSGEIFADRISDETIAVAAVKLEHGEVSSALAPVERSEDSFAAGQKLADELARDDLRSVLVLSDGLNVNGSELVRGLSSKLSDEITVTGGLAGDGDRFESTWVLRDGLPTSGVVSAIGFHGDRVQVGHGSKGGWDIFGPERVVTKSRGNVLYELDGKPALELYKKYLGDRASGLPATALLFPLALRADESSEKTLVRTVLAVSEEDQSMTFAGDIPEGFRAQLMRANFDRLIQGASEAAVHSKNGSNGHPVLAIAISCVGRRLVLGERTEEETEATLEMLPQGSSQIGFYSYGEISPYTRGTCDLHNQTMTLTTLAEI